MKQRQTFGRNKWREVKEKIESLPTGVYSVGVGMDLTNQSGLTEQDLVAGLDKILPQLIDGGANKVAIGGFQFYIRRRGKAIDMGTREDFNDLGWGRLCDELDGRDVAQSN